MGSVAKNPDPRVLRYLKYYEFRLTSDGNDDRLATIFGCTSRDLYATLVSDGFPVCRNCGETPADENHCKPAEQQRKTRTGAGSHTELPSAADALSLLQPVVEAFDEYLLDLTTLKEVYRDERFEAVEHYELTALVDLEHNTSFGPTTIPLGATRVPPHPLVALIAAYIIEDKPLDPLIEK